MVQATRDGVIGSPSAKRVLIISYEYPPKGGSGVQRPAKFAKYLPKYGWSPFALTVADPPTRLFDEDLAREVAGVPVTRAWSLEPARLYAALGRLRNRLKRGEPDPQGSSTAGKRSLTGLPSGLIRFIQAFFMPDEKIGWYPWAVRAGIELIKKQKIDVIFASGPPFSAFVIARQLSSRTGIPWVADFRDPWIGHYYIKAATPVHAWMDRRMEAQVVASASAVIATTVTVTEAFMARYPDQRDKFETITNGFDRSDFQEDSGAPAETFLVSHMGSFYEQRNPAVFLEAAAALAAESEDFARDLRIDFIGAIDPPSQALIDKSSLLGKISLSGYLPHEECLRRFRRATVLLFITDPEEARMHLAGKLFEYLAMAQPILALTGPGQAGEIIETTGRGIVVDGSDLGAAKKALLRLYSDYRAGTHSLLPDEQRIAKYERQALTGALASVFDRSLARSKK